VHIIELGPWALVGGYLDGVKPNEMAVKFSWVKFEREEVTCRKCSEVSKV
jgi:hypothetical protein